MNRRLDQLFTFLAESPDEVFLKYAIANEYVKLERISEALEAFNRIETEFPTYLGTYYQLGKLYERLNRVEDALQTYQKGMLVAQQQNNRHTFGELQGAWNLLNDEQSDDW